MAVQAIKCQVASCYYNENGSRCLAETIQVQNNYAGKGNAARMEVGTLEGAAQAAISNQTMCGTFIPKEKGPKEGIRRLS